MKTIKGFGMGKAGESANTTHSTKKLDAESLKGFRDRFHVPLKTRPGKLPFIKPAPDSPEALFIKETREALGGSLPSRRTKAEPQPVPALETFDALLKGSGDNTMSTTMVLSECYRPWHVIKFWDHRWFR